LKREKTRVDNHRIGIGGFCLKYHIKVTKQEYGESLKDEIDFESCRKDEKTRKKLQIG